MTEYQVRELIKFIQFMIDNDRPRNMMEHDMRELKMKWIIYVLTGEEE
jgi:hypothetical protein